MIIGNSERINVWFVNRNSLIYEDIRDAIIKVTCFFISIFNKMGRKVNAQVPFFGTVTELGTFGTFEFFQ